MTRRDLARVVAIERDAFGRDAWPSQAFRDLIVAFARAKPPRGALWVAEDRETGEVFGYAGVEVSALWGEMDIVNIAVAAAHRQRGIGRLFIERIIRLCRQRRVPLLWLRVRASNRTARRFYRRMGFRARGSFHGYYVEPDEPAIILAMDL